MWNSRVIWGMACRSVVRTHGSRREDTEIDVNDETSQVHWSIEGLVR